MPLFRHDILPDQTEIGIWKIEESATWFHQNIVLYQGEIAELDPLSPRKQLEWLAARYLLHQMSGRAIRGACLKDSFGKPYLAESAFFISISHSHDMTAIVASPKLCGVDIQLRNHKLERIAPKFLRESEQLQLEVMPDRLSGLHWIWGAKEAIYKAYGMKKIAFKENISVHWDQDSNQGQGMILKDGMQLIFELRHQMNGDFHLVLAYLKGVVENDL